MKKKTVCRLYALSWFLIGGWLLYKGLRLLLDPAIPGATFSAFGRMIDTKEMGLLLVVLGLALGRLKAPLLARAARRNRGRIELLEEPVAIKRIFAPAYLVLIALMMGLGVAMTFFQVHPALRGVIDVTIGGALIGGARHYLKRESTCGATCGTGCRDKSPGPGRVARGEVAERSDEGKS